MADGTKIEWSDATVNAVNGCSVISPGCKHCYAMKQAHRFPIRQDLTVKTAGGMVWTGEVRLSQTALLQPLRWKRPRKIFWNAHGDLFHENVPDEWIDRVFASCALSPQHQHQILTKRSARMREYFANPEVVRRVLTAARELRYSVTPDPEKRPRQFQRVMSASARLTAWTVIGGVASDIFLRTEPGRSYPSWVTWPLPNVWLGVSVEDQQRANERREDLRNTPAVVRFVSYEPALEIVDWEGWEFLDWLIAGGESGPKARPVCGDAHRGARNFCAAHGITFFFKQHGEWIDVRDLHRLPGGSGPGFGAYDHCPYDRRTETVRVGKKSAGRLLDGVTHDGMPA